MRCSYCCARKPGENSFPGKPQPDYTLDEIFAIIDEAKKLGLRFIALSGGEPLLRDDIGEIIKYSKKRGLFTELYTNGTLIHRHASVLPFVDRICVSLDGPKEIHELDRGEGSYDRIYQNIMLLSEKNIDFVLNVTTNKNTLKTYKHVLDLARNVSAKFGSIEVSYNFDKNSDESAATVAEYREFYKKLFNDKSQGWSVFKPLKLIKDGMKSPDWFSHLYLHKKGEPWPDTGFRTYKCMMGKQLAYLDGEGTLAPCPNLYGKKGYNIRESGLKEAWQKLGNSLDCDLCRSAHFCAIVLFFNLNIPTLVESGLYFLRPKKRGMP